MSNNEQSWSLSSLLNRCAPNLIKELEKNCSLFDLKTSQAFQEFVNNFVKFLNDEKGLVNNIGWEENEEFLKILDEINKGVEKMITEKTLVLAGKGAFAAGFGLGALIGGAAVYWYINKQKEIEKEQHKPPSIVKNIANKVLAGSEQRAYPVQPSYKLHTLLLVISANRLPDNLSEGHIDNNTINTLISGAAWAYCFTDENNQGIQIMNAADRSRVSIDEIDRTTEINIFIRLELSAESEIIAQRNKLNIKQKINPNSTGQVFEISRLKNSRSVSNFYEI